MQVIRPPGPRRGSNEALAKILFLPYKREDGMPGSAG